MLTAARAAALGLICLCALGACERPPPPPPLEGGDLSEQGDLPDLPDLPDDSLDLPVDAPDSGGDLGDLEPPADLPQGADVPEADAQDLETPDAEDLPEDLPGDVPEDLPQGPLARLAPLALGEGECARAQDCEQGMGCYGGRCEDILRLSAGEAHTCAQRDDNTLFCWGRDTEGAAQAPPGRFVQVTAGARHSCALTLEAQGEGGEVLCWGDNSQGQAASPLGRFVQISAGATHNCGLRADYSLHCWGEALGQVPSGTWQSVTVGERHACALSFDPEIGVRCWGDAALASLEPPAGRFVRIDAGRAHTCGVLEETGQVLCWGEDGQGQLSGAPSQQGWTHVSAGGDGACAWVQGGGDFVCWGDLAGEPLEGCGGRLPMPENAQANPANLAVGSGHACALLDSGLLRCWGDNCLGEASPPWGRFVDVSSGALHSCALNAEGSALCWGEGEGSLPVSGLEDTRWSLLSAGLGFTCGLLEGSGRARCWGDGESGQLSLPTGEAMTQISAGWFHSCALRAGSGSVVCAGSQDDGRLEAPSLVAAQLSAGDVASCALEEGGQVSCWGSGEAARPPEGLRLWQLSAGRTHICGVERQSHLPRCWGVAQEGQGEPVQQPMVEVQAADFYSCGLLGEGQVRCWGNLRDGAYALPQGEYTRISAGSAQLCGLRRDGRLVCRGQEATFH